MTMTELQQHQFGALCEALYRKERETMHQDTDGDSITTAATTSADPYQGKPDLRLRPHVVRTALRQAEQAADEINARLRDAEQDRDDLARKLGVSQDTVDRLLSERLYRSKHIRELQAAQPVSDVQ
jgi:predicted DNA-binding protein (UPF0251 family)